MQIGANSANGARILIESDMLSYKSSSPSSHAMLRMHGKEQIIANTYYSDILSYKSNKISRIHIIPSASHCYHINPGMNGNDNNFSLPMAAIHFECMII